MTSALVIGRRRKSRHIGQVVREVRSQLQQPRRAIKANDGLLDVTGNLLAGIIVRASGPLPGLLATWEAMSQTDLGESSGGHVFRSQAREVRIETQPRRVVEADGNALGRTPITASIRPRALRVIVPKK